MNRNLVEFIGTFFLVTTVGLVSVEPGAGLLGPLAIGTVLAVMVYAGGPISGGHYNPAVSFGVWLRGKLTLRRMVNYWIAQLLAGVAAAMVVRYLKGAGTAAATAVLPTLVAEFIFTFALVFVVLNVATSRRTEGNQYFGFAIGFTVMVGAIAVGPISGGVFNPAVAAGAVVMGLVSAARIWAYLLATLLAAALAAAAFRVVEPQG